MYSLTMLRFIQGDTWKRRFLFTQHGIPVDLNFSTARFQIRSFDDEMVVAEASIENKNLWIKPEIGAIDIEFAPFVTRKIEPGQYKSDLEIVYMDGTTQSTPHILIQVVDDVTELTRVKPDPKNRIIPLPSSFKKKTVTDLTKEIIAKKGGKIA